MERRRIGVGVVGASPQASWGSIAHLPALARSDRCRAVAVGTTRLSTARETAEKFGVPHAFADPRALAAHPEVDVVGICVRVPHHRELIEIALHAGKHVYCEWPLAVDAAEAGQLALLARRAGVVAMVGLQGRLLPAIAYARDLVAEGGIGRVVGASLLHSGAWPTVLPPAQGYLQDRRSGATFLTICGGHDLDALQWIAGAFAPLAAIVKTAFPAVRAEGDGAPFVRTSPDEIAAAGTIGEAVATIRLHGGPGLGSGFALEVNGEAGNLVIGAPPGTFGFQLGEVTLHRTRPEGGPLVPLDIPPAYRPAPAATPAGPAFGVGRMYERLADAIETGRPVAAGFDDAAALHRLLEAIEACAGSAQGAPAAAGMR